MERVNLSRGMLPFAALAKSLALSQKIVSRGLIISLISAFFIVLAFNLILNLLVQTVGNQPDHNLTAVTIEEKVAFQPSQAVSQQFRQGYLGN